MERGGGGYLRMKGRLLEGEAIETGCGGWSVLRLTIKKTVSFCEG